MVQKWPKIVKKGPKSHFLTPQEGQLAEQRLLCLKAVRSGPGPGINARVPPWDSSGSGSKKGHFCAWKQWKWTFWPFLALFGPLLAPFCKAKCTRIGVLKRVIIPPRTGPAWNNWPIGYGQRPLLRPNGVKTPFWGLKWLKTTFFGLKCPFDTQMGFYCLLVQIYHF